MMMNMQQTLAKTQEKTRKKRKKWQISSKILTKMAQSRSSSSTQINNNNHNKFHMNISKMFTPKTSSLAFLILLLLASGSERGSGKADMSGYASALMAADSAPPRITIQPNDLVAIENESAELNCDAEGQPEPTIEWYHNGQLIKTSSHSRTTMGGSIQFLDIRPATKQHQPSDTGVYFCLAKNSLGQARSRNASLQVAYIKQEFKLAPKDKLVSVGESATFDCLPEAWPEPNIKWRHNGQLIEVNEVSSSSGGNDHQAKYTINRIARATSTSDELATNEADQARKTLNTDNSQQLIDLFGSQLVIRQTDKSDQGKYSCLVETKGSHRLIERESTPAKLTVLVKPYFIEAPQHTTVEAGGQVRLQCRLGGEPEPVVSWRKQNGQALSEKTKIDPVDKTLILDQVSVADQATYICEGENPVGSVRTMATVSVNSRPRLIVQPEDQEADQGSKVQLRCSGDANPPPMLFWYKEGHRQLMFAPNPTTPITEPYLQKPHPSSLEWPQAAPLVASDYRYGASQSDTSPAINKLFTMPINPDQYPPASFSNNYFGNRIYVDNQGTLNIVNVTASDSGYYACALISSVGSVMAKAKVTVRQSAGLLGTPDYYNPSSSMLSTGSSSKFDLLPPPVIKLGAANQTLPTNTSATLVCEVVSQVAYKIQWFFESQTLQEEPPRVMVLETGALNINNLRISDTGIYTCVVTAANDQLMPLASPLEPLDSSMLTQAPPIQQSTTHSTLLKVASPMNPNIQFYRMDTFAYPSSPGAAYLVSTNGNDAVTIAWPAPADSGTLPIKEYVVEHYDTSQESLGWRVIYRIKGKESLLIDGLSADGSHFFVIRAANSHGTGPSSAIAGPIRTVAGETRYSLESQKRRASMDSKRVNYDPSNQREDTNLAREKLMTISTNLVNYTPVSSTSIRLDWSTQINGSLESMIGGYFSPSSGAPDVNEFLEGFSIRYRATGIGKSVFTRDQFLGTNWNQWPSKSINAPASLPLVTSYVDESTLTRRKRDLTNYFDYSQEFNEVRVVDHNTDHYTINGLAPFTLYQFFVVPYYKDIDGIPSNILIAQTNEDRPSVAPPNLTVRPLNTTAVRLLWLHIPSIYANGILRSYTLRINRSEISTDIEQSEQLMLQHTNLDAPIILNLPLGGLHAAPTNSFYQDGRIQPNTNGAIQQYIVMYDLTNLTYKSFYSVQVAAATSAGSGPWSDAQNFIMDPVLLQQKNSANELDDVMSKSLTLTGPQSYGNLISNNQKSLYLIISVSLIIISVILASGYLLYRRHNQKVLTWKKTISEHFTNKFYMPSSVVDHHVVPNPNQQSIYDHQQHLIYSRNPAHPTQQSLSQQAIWTNNNGCISSSGSGSILYHEGLLPINNDLNNINTRKLPVNEQQALMLNNNQDMNSRLASNNQPLIDSSRILSAGPNQAQVVQHSDYYSVISNVAEYEELESQQRNNMPVQVNGDRMQTASSNSDTSCPSSVTRLIPNANYNRDFLAKTYEDNSERHEMVLQQQLGCSERKQAFATMHVNGDHGSRTQPIIPLSPYATTNLMKMPQQVFSNHQMSVVDNSRQQNHFVIHPHNASGNLTLDDSAKTLLNHHQQHINGVHNPISVFRTLQRNPVNFQSRRQSSSKKNK